MTVGQDALRASISAGVSAAVDARRGDDPAAFETALDRLVTTPRADLSAILLERSTAALATAWSRGWQPADVTGFVGRTAGTRSQSLVALLIAAEARSYQASDVDDRWTAQLVDLGRPPWDGPESFVDRWAATVRIDPFEAVRLAVEVLSIVEKLPKVPRLITPPGVGHPPQARVRRSGAAGRDQATRMLDRIRALLAKAESSRYASEADAYTTKAQELTARYSIDQALLAGRTDDRVEPTAIRVALDSPYEGAKALLLQGVAEANHAQSVWSDHLGFATVFGFAPDLAAVELIYASLLVQGTAVMVSEGSGRRSREFRESFLLAYAARIGERLQASSAQVWTSDDLLPVLASREAAVREKADEVFGETTTGRSRVRDGRGWKSGMAAADAAHLGKSGPTG